MINIGDVNVGNEIILNSFQSQVYNEALTKLENFGIGGYDIDHESYVVQKTLAKHIAETISPEEENIAEIPRLSQIVFQTLTNPDLYDSDIVSEGLLQWLEIGNPYSFFSKKNTITDLSGNANDVKFPSDRVKPNGFRRNGTVNRKEIPSLIFNGKGSRLNASTVIDDVLQPDEKGDVNGLSEGSVEMWVKLKKKRKGSGQQYHGLFQFHCPGTNYGFASYVGRNGEIRITKSVFDNSGDTSNRKRKTTTSSTNSNVVPNYEWVHLVITFTKNGPICYANTQGYKFPVDRYAVKYDGMLTGFMEGFDPAELPNGQELNLAPENLWIGAVRRNTGKFVHNLVGEVSSFRIYDRILEDDEIEQNFDSSKGQYTGE
jgi:hypothetical protein